MSIYLNVLIHMISLALWSIFKNESIYLNVLKHMISLALWHVFVVVAALFSVALLNAADASTYKAWAASNRGCFILIM